MMANFTMEIGEMMNNPLIRGVFTFPYDFYGNEQEKAEFEKLFIQYYYFTEIGFETPERFKLKLQAKLNTIMPYYRQLAMTEWDKLRTVEQMMTSKSLTETTTHEQTITGDNETTTSANTSASSSGTDNSQGEMTSKESRMADGVSMANLDDNYLTGVSNDTSTTTNSSTQTATQNSNQSQKGNNNQSLKETTTFSSVGDIGIQTPAYAIAEWRKVLININQMIIDECRDLFMKIY